MAQEEPNVLEWLDKLGSALGSKHGFAASVLFSTHKNYIVPSPNAIFQDTDMPLWSSEQLVYLQADAMKTYIKEKRELVVKLNMLYHDMWSWISLESRQHNNGDSRSEAMHTNFGPQVLMTLIRETHLTNVACGAVRDKDLGLWFCRQNSSCWPSNLVQVFQYIRRSSTTYTSHTSRREMQKCPKSKSLSVSWAASMVSDVVRCASTLKLRFMRFLNEFKTCWTRV